MRPEKPLDWLAFLFLLIALFFVACAILMPRGLRAQAPDECHVLCAPDLALEPTISIENIAGKHRTATLEGGVPVDTVRAETEAVFEVILSMGIPTEIPRVGLTLEAIWAPFAGTDSNPFTGRTAEEIGEEEIRDNAVELEGEINFDLVTFDESNGWVGAHIDVVDQLSPAETPGATGTYTHKVDMELDMATSPLARLDVGGWWEEVELEGSLDYMVSGIPDAGDRFGNEVFLDDASPWSFSVVLVLPLAPAG